MYDSSSVDGLLEYARASNSQGEALLQAGVSDFYVWVTFRRALNEKEFQSLVKDTGLTVLEYTMRAIGKNGSRVTIGGAPSNSELLPASDLAQAVAEVKARENSENVSVNGVFEAIGTIDVAGYKQLVGDPRIFIVDVTGTLVYNSNKFQATADMGWADYAAKLQIGGGGEVLFGTWKISA